MAISVVNLFLFRLLLFVILIGDKASIDVTITDTVKEAAIVCVSVIVFSFLFRAVEPKFKFAEIHNIKRDVSDQVTKKKCDIGVCGKCGMETKVAKERFISTFGKSERYFCDNCGIFLRTDPLMAIFLGLSESAVTLIFLFGIAALSIGTSSKPSMFQSVFFVGMFLGE